MANNQIERVENAISEVQGPLIGSNLLQSFKDQMLKQEVFRIMFGGSAECADRIYVRKMPNVNESIVPFLILSWQSDTFRSFNQYFDGTIKGLLALPAHIQGDYNAQRRVGNMIQRFMGGPMKMFDPAVNPGLIEFGIGTQFVYDGLANFSGIQLPVIQMTIPFKFDLQQLRIQSPGFDPFSDLDEADLLWVEKYSASYIDGNDKKVLIEEGAILDTGQNN